MSFQKSTFLLFLSFLTTPLLAFPSCQHSDTIFRCLTYLDNYDGDTVTVHIPNTHPLFGHAIKVRLIGIDTPEIKGSSPCEKEKAFYAKKYVKSLLEKAEEIELRSPARDKYFRVLGDLWFDGRSLKDLLLEKKLAIPYDGGRKPNYNWCQKS